MAILNIIELVSAVLLMAAILLQNRGTGLGAAFGGEGNVYRTKRGLEKTLFKATIALAVIFLGTALATTLQQPSRVAPVSPETSSVPLDLTNAEAPTPAADASPIDAGESTAPAPTP